MTLARSYGWIAGLVFTCAGCSQAVGPSGPDAADATTDIAAPDVSAVDAPAVDAPAVDAPALDAAPDAPALDAAADAPDSAPARVDAGVDRLMPPPITRTMAESQLAPQRQSCTFTAGAWPADTIGTDYPVGTDIPINHVLVIMQENRSFDHYLGRLVAQGYYQAGDFSTGSDGGRGTGFSHSDQLDGPPPGWSQLDTDGTIVVPHPDTAHCYGLNHSWADMHDDYDNGLMDHFVTNNDPDGQRTMYYQDDTVIPFYYALASTFAVGDQYHASVMSSTWPNRYFLMAATSFGIGDNSYCTIDTGAHPVNHIFASLEAAGRSWKDYTDGPHMEDFFPYFGIGRAATYAHYGNARCDLMTDIANNTLPDVSFIMGDEVTESSDEGPSDLPGIGGQWVEGILRALFASPAWQSSAVFIVYDENGGTADHVLPAPACIPDTYPPHDEDNNPLPGAFDQTGFRVPFILVSPYARAHFVSHTVYDHTSITRFIETRFGLPALTARDANATPPLEMFDFQNPPFMTPPTITAHTVPDPATLMQCGQAVAPLGCGDQ